MRIPKSVLTQTCQIRPYLGQSPTGESYGSTLVDVPCRFEQHRKKYVSQHGKEFISAGRVFLLPDPANWGLSEDSLFTIDGLRWYKVMAVSEAIGFKPSHVEMLVE